MLPVMFDDSFTQPSSEASNLKNLKYDPGGLPPVSGGDYWIRV